MRVIVVGAGLGGMAAALRLAAAGHEVDVHEKEPVPGGKAGSVTRDGFRFDTGPTLLTMPGEFRELFARAGERLEDHVTFLPVDPLCTYHFADGTVLPAWRDPERFAQEVGRTMRDSADALRAYLRHARELYEAAAPIFLHRSLHERSTWLSRDLLPLLPRVPRLDAFRTLHAAHASFFRDPRLVQLFDRFATYNGSDPYRAPATLALISHVEHGMGGYAVAGGIHALAHAVCRCAAKAGARFHFTSPVTEILLERRRAAGVVVAGQRHAADVVICNVDVLMSWNTLLRRVPTPADRRRERREQSTSGMLFLWGLRDGAPRLGANTILFPERYEGEFTDLFRRRVVPEDPTVYIHVSPGREGPGQAWYVLVNAPPDTGQDWAAAARDTRCRVLARIRTSLGSDPAPLIAMEEIITPPDFEARTGSFRGSLYGMASNSPFSAFLRHRNRLPRVPGLYFCGGSAHPGGGTPLVTLSGKITAELVLRHETGRRRS
jgi:phytoene desaturase